MSHNIGLMAAVAAAVGVEGDQAEKLVITTDLIAEHFPAIATELRGQGAEAEHARLSGIDAAMAPGFADIIKAHKADRSKQPGDAALAIIAAQNAKREQMGNSLSTDENQLAGLRSATPPKADAGGGISQDNMREVGRQAQAYIREQKQLGRNVSPVEAVNHITSQGA